ncbi:hypothetical protein HDU82_007644 [Entophlyctis luteolus]|nr:hypothetical protein HDU82_007644 [Entophlyctis luteolus]
MRFIARGYAAALVSHSDLLDLAPAHLFSRRISLGTESTNSTRDAELSGLTQALLQSKADAIVFNLFALEAFSIAEKLQIPCLAVSTFFACDFGPPESFEMELAKTEFASWLFLPENVSWLTAVKHWMWRLFLDDHGSYREQVLELPPIPNFSLFKQPPSLVYLMEECLFNLTGVSPSQLPESVSIAGMFLEKAGRCVPSSNETVNSQIPELTAFLNSCQKKIIHIGFGSMDGLHPSIAKEQDTIIAIVHKIICSLQSNGIAAIWVISARNPYLLVQKVIASCSYHDILVVTGEISYCHLFNSGIVCGSLNHGGLGTATQVLQAGLKQVIAPFMFDQRKWGERLQHAGLGRVLSDSLEMVGNHELTDALEWLAGDMEMQGAIKLNLQQWQLQVNKNPADMNQCKIKSSLPNQKIKNELQL